MIRSSEIQTTHFLNKTFLKRLLDCLNRRKIQNNTVYILKSKLLYTYTKIE